MNASPSVLPTGLPIHESDARAASPPRASLLHAFERVRRFSEELAAPLAPEDCVVQTMPDVSPTKWHLAHTSWFFDTFLLQPHLAGFRPKAREYAYLFNSYYNAAGPMHCRDRRGFISRPTLQETLDYRQYVDAHVHELLERADDPQLRRIADVLVLGLHHEQQHQELLLTDIKHVFAQNPLHPVYRAAPPDATRDATEAPPRRWIAFDEAVRWIGAVDDGGFVFDNERPRHRVFVGRFALADRLVTNAEYTAFIDDGGYARAELWLSLGWATVQQQGWRAPLYWQRIDDRWHEFTLAGLRPVRDAEPVCHVSFFEADAFARWAGARLPTEAEWETVAQGLPVRGNLVEQSRLHPSAADATAPTNTAATPRQMFGDVWEWTGSSYSPYPGYTPPDGALGEYNGKFMCNQYVLRGGSCASSVSHLRATYRNFFPPEKRWQFTGIRLAQDSR